MSSHRLINKQNLRRFLLEYAGRSRAHRYTRVADGVYDQIELAVREKCRDIVRSQPSAGRTIR
jgi:hypothetical protein